MRLLSVVATSTTSCVLTAPLTGWKVVAADWGPVHIRGAGERYVVGSRHELASGETPSVRYQGYHFVPDPLLLALDVSWQPWYKLVRVEIPAGAAVSMDGTAYAASAMLVVADETATASALLTGVLRICTDDSVSHTTYVDGTETARYGDPYYVETSSSGQREKAWLVDGGWRRVTASSKADGTVDVHDDARPDDAAAIWGPRLARQEWYESVEQEPLQPLGVS
jgi:hypothetical protein